MELNDNGDTNHNQSPWNNPEEHGKEIKETGDRGKNWNFPDPSNAKIGENNGDKPGTIKETCCHLDYSGKPSSNADVRNSQMNKMIIIKQPKGFFRRNKFLWNDIDMAMQKKLSERNWISPNGHPE